MTTTKTVPQTEADFTGNLASQGYTWHADGPGYYTVTKPDGQTRLVDFRGPRPACSCQWFHSPRNHAGTCKHIIFVELGLMAERLQAQRVETSRLCGVVAETRQALTEQERTLARQRRLLDEARADYARTQRHFGRVSREGMEAEEDYACTLVRLAEACGGTVWEWRREVEAEPVVTVRIERAA